MAIKQVWIGLVEVRPASPESDLGDAKGAFANALAWVSGREEFDSAVASAAAEIGLTAIEFEDVEPFDVRAGQYELESELQELASEVDLDHHVRFDDFQAYDNVDG